MAPPVEEPAALGAPPVTTSVKAFKKEKHEVGETEKEKGTEKRPRVVETNLAERASPDKKVPKASVEAVATDAPVRRALNLEVEGDSFPDTQVDPPQPEMHSGSKLAAQQTRNTKTFRVARRQKTKRPCETLWLGSSSWKLP